MVDTWSCSDVCDWLARQGFADYAPQFQAQGVTGRDLLRLTPTDIRCALGVTALQHRKDLYAAILRLREGLGEPPGAPAGGLGSRRQPARPAGRSASDPDAGRQFPTAYPSPEEYGARPMVHEYRPASGEWWPGDRLRGPHYPPDVDQSPRSDFPLHRSFSGTKFPQHGVGAGFGSAPAPHRFHDGRYDSAAAPWQWDYSGGTPTLARGGSGSLARAALPAEPLPGYPTGAMPQRQPAQPPPAGDAQLGQLELLAADLAAIEARVNQLQGGLAPECLPEIQALLQTMDGIILHLDPLGPTDLWVQYGEVVRVQRRLLLQRADILKQRLVLLRHTCQLRGQGFGPMSPSRAAPGPSPYPAQPMTPAGSGRWPAAAPNPNHPGGPARPSPAQPSPNSGRNPPRPSEAPAGPQPGRAKEGAEEPLAAKSPSEQEITEEEEAEGEGEGSQRRVSRSYSSRSTSAIETLLTLGQELAGYERRAQDLTPESRDDLATLFGKVERLLLHSIDAVATADLCSGRDDARAERRQLVQRAEALLTFLSGLRRTAASAPAEEVGAAAGDPCGEPGADPDTGDAPAGEEGDALEAPEAPPGEVGALESSMGAADFARKYSTKSISILQRIDDLKAEVDDLERTVAGFTPGDASHKDEIAQLFGAVERLLLQRIDAVLCCDLQSGQQDAKAARRGLVRRCNTLLDRLVELKGLL